MNRSEGTLTVQLEVLDAVTGKITIQCLGATQKGGLAMKDEFLSDSQSPSHLPERRSKVLNAAADRFCRLIELNAELSTGLDDVQRFLRSIEETAVKYKEHHPYVKHCTLTVENIDTLLPSTPSIYAAQASRSELESRAGQEAVPGPSVTRSLFPTELPRRETVTSPNGAGLIKGLIRGLKRG